MKKLIMCLAAFMILSGCSDAEYYNNTPTVMTKAVQEKPIQVENAAALVIPPTREPEVEVIKISEFYDGLAYNRQRGVYRIKDKVTGKEYLGISGIGISETGSHNCGKACTSQDER